MSKIPYKQLPLLVSQYVSVCLSMSVVSTRIYMYLHVSTRAATALRHQAEHIDIAICDPYSKGAHKSHGQLSESAREDFLPQKNAKKLRKVESWPKKVDFDGFWLVFP